MRVSVEQLVECELTGETEVLGENLLQCDFVHPGRNGGKPVTNRLSYGTARPEKLASTWT
jgi:hypothetical protein